MHPDWHLTGQVIVDPRSYEQGSAPSAAHAPQFRCTCKGVVHHVDSGVAMVIAGRLDELSALQAELRLHGNPDALAVVRAAYGKWGPREFAAHLYGDFALVLWDRTAQRLVLSRSPSGFYPLCYAPGQSVLRFAGTPQDLLRGTDLPVTLDEQAMAEWLTLQPRLSDRTLFAGIHRVPPGASVLFERGRLTTSIYWQPASLPTLHLRTHQAYADLLRETLQTAVRDHLRDTRGAVASQLSGGLDSSTVNALAAEQLAPLGRQIFAFTAVPSTMGQAPVEGRFYDESNHAAAVAAQYGNIVHTRVTTEQTSLFQVLDRYTDVEATPPFNPHHLQWIDRTYAAAAATGATTLLTGSMGNMTMSAAGTLAFMDALQHGRLHHATSLFAADRRSGTRALHHLPALVCSAFAPRLLDVVDRLRQAPTRLEEFTGVRPAFARANGVDIDRWDRRAPFRTARELALYSVDRFDVGMFHESPRRLYGLNATDPTFDRRVVELTLRIPLEQFCEGGVPRALIRTAMQGRLPDMVRLERRRGLQSSDFLPMLHRERAAIAHELGQMQEIDLLRRAIDIPLLQQRLQWTEPQAIAYGWHPYSNRLMRAVSLGRFVRRMMDGSLFSTLPPRRDDDPDTVCIVA